MYLKSTLKESTNMHVELVVSKSGGVSIKKFVL